ncbi:BrnA antitoxin family protein [Cupriavidus gilardii]|nr:BrnA antitoxin family protein [Cupriavidus gilardii]
MSKKPKLIMPTDEEDAAINRGIAEDPDTYEVPPEDFKKMKRLGRRGRPPVESPKKLVTVRYEPEIINAFKASGDGWQTRMNDALAQTLNITFIGGPLDGQTVRDNPYTLTALLSYRPIEAFPDDPLRKVKYHRVTIKREVEGVILERDFFLSEEINAADGKRRALRAWEASSLDHCLTDF